MKHLAPKTAVKIFALTVSFLLLASTRPVQANLLPDIIANLPTASNMFKWSNNFVTGLIEDSAMTVAVGCPLDEISGAGTLVQQKAKIKSCTQGGGLGKAGSSVSNPGGPSSMIPPSLLGITMAAALEAPRHSDIYPVNLALYVESVKRESPIVPTSAYAAGLGDAVLSGTILGLWQALRNFSYVIFVLMLVAFGFMVMFRYKINPQTVITVQAALPKVIVSLLFITFSYPIGAFGINLMVALTNFALNFHIFQFGSLFDNVAGMLGAIVALVALVSPGAGSLFMAVIAIGLVIAVLLATIAAVISIFTRIARIVAMTLFAPLQFAFGAIPGKEDAITGWFKSLLGNALAVPAIVLMMAIGMDFIIRGPQASYNAGGDWASSFIMGFLGVFVNFIIGLWFIWNARNAPKWIEGAMAIGGGWSPGMAPKTAGKR